VFQSPLVRSQPGIRSWYFFQKILVQVIQLKRVFREEVIPLIVLNHLISLPNLKINYPYFRDLLRFAIYDIQVTVPLSFKKIDFIPLRILYVTISFVNILVVPTTTFHVD
jgi:hypothetical protein